MRHLEDQRIENRDVQPQVAGGAPRHRVRPEQQAVELRVGGKDHAGRRNVVSSVTMQNLSDEQRAFVEAIRDFAKRECGTREQRDALTEGGREPHNQGLYERIAALGWPGVAIPEEYGGAGGGALDMCLLCEEFARGLIPMGFFPVTMMAARPVELFGTQPLKEEIL